MSRQSKQGSQLLLATQHTQRSCTLASSNPACCIAKLRGHNTPTVLQGILAVALEPPPAQLPEGCCQAQSRHAQHLGVLCRRQAAVAAAEAAAAAEAEVQLAEALSEHEARMSELQSEVQRLRSSAHSYLARDEREVGGRSGLTPCAQAAGSSSVTLTPCACLRLMLSGKTPCPVAPR